MIKRCSECDSKVKRLNDDPRSPPLELDACLCDDCFEAAAEELIEEYQGNIDSLNDEISNLRKEVKYENT